MTSTHAKYVASGSSNVMRCYRRGLTNNIRKHQSRHIKCFSSIAPNCQLHTWSSCFLLKIFKTIVQVPLAQLKYLEKRLQAFPDILNYGQNNPSLLDISVLYSAINYQQI
jgi:hypothetical protein